MKKLVCLLLLTLSVLVACSSSDRASVSYHNQFNFTQVHYYSTYERNSSFSDKQNISDVRRNNIEIAIDKAMAIQGFEYSEFAKADIILSYHILGLNRRDYSRYNAAVLFCERCLKANAWHSEDQNGRLSEGSLILDLLNPKNKRSVWRSVFPLNIKDKDNSQEVNGKIQHAVKTMLEKYPRKTNKSINKSEYKSK